jgi:hypothetical protein
VLILRAARKAPSRFCSWARPVRRLKPETDRFFLVVPAVVVHQAELYTGNKPAVPDTDLARDFTKDRAAAEKKYNPEKQVAPDIIVEGVISAAQPEKLSVRLAGHEG